MVERTVWHGRRVGKLPRPHVGSATDGVAAHSDSLSLIVERHEHLPGPSFSDIPHATAVEAMWAVVNWRGGVHHGVGDVSLTPESPTLAWQGH